MYTRENAISSAATVAAAANARATSHNPAATAPAITA
jgi:hypothetical protein